MNARVGVGAAIGFVLVMSGLGAGQVGAASSFVSDIAVTHVGPDWRAGEPSVAVNPRNPRQVAVATTEVSNISAPVAGQTPTLGTDQLDGQHVPGRCALTRSIDGGHTWTYSLPPWGAGHCGDAMLVAAPDGTLYMLAAIPMSVWASRDFGRTWVQRGSVAAGDRPYFVGDPARSADLWVTGGDDAKSVLRCDGLPCAPGLRGVAGGIRTVYASHDGGRTWNGGHASPGAQITEAYGVLATAGGSSFSTSRDDGATWTTRPAPWNVNDSELVNANPSVAADPTRPGHFAVDVRTQNAQGGYDVEAIFLTTDSGRHWKRVAELTGDRRKKHYHQWIRFSRTGVLAVVWRESVDPWFVVFLTPALRVNDLDVYGALSLDGGAHFTRPIRLTRQSSPGPSSIGDDCACGIDFTPTTMVTAWGDYRTAGNREIYFGQLPMRKSPTR